MQQKCKPLFLYLMMTHPSITNRELCVRDIAETLDRGLYTSGIVFDTLSRFHNEFVDTAEVLINSYPFVQVQIPEDGTIPPDTFTDFDPDQIFDLEMFDYQGGYLNHSGYCGEDTNYELGLAALVYMQHAFKHKDDLVKEEDMVQF